MSLPSFVLVAVVVVVVHIVFLSQLAPHVPIAVAHPLQPHHGASEQHRQQQQRVETSITIKSVPDVDTKPKYNHLPNAFPTSLTPTSLHDALQVIRQHSSSNNNNNSSSPRAIRFPFTCGDPTSGGSTSSSNLRVRKELRDLSPFELRRWRTVMRTLMTERPSNASFNPPPSFWDLLVAVHIVFGYEAHNGAYFLPWHRFFLLYLENHIRAYYYSDFALPYWDWSQPEEAADPAVSTVWGPDYLGGSAHEPDSNNTTTSSSNGAPIPNGPFHGTFAHYLDNHPVRRGFNSSRSGSMRPLVNSSTLAALIHRPVVADSDWTSWGAFSDAVETAHNRLHADVGGDMFVTRTSPNDPVFYVHHAFVDRVWWERQRVHGWEEFSGNHSFPAGRGGNGSSVTEAARTVNVSKEFVFRYFNLPVSTSFEQHCVRYQAYRPKGRARDGERGKEGGTNEKGQGTEGDNSSSGDEVCEETDMMSVERCRHGQAVLDEAATARFQEAT